MGSIAVFLSALHDAPVHVVEMMSAAAPHRGPHVETLVHGRCALSIRNTGDLRDASLGRVGDLAVAFVGSLDNASELSAGLERDGARLADEPTLPELLAACYRAHREAMPARLRGVFAGVLTDGESLYAFRDHLGNRPLFYRVDHRGFYAATEAKQVVAGAGISKEPDLEVVERIFYNDITDEMPCALRGVRRLPKSTGIVVDRGGTHLRRYWQPELLLETAKLSADELQARFNEVMDQAVTRCFTGPDAVSLSGGIDSPGVAAFAAPRHVELTGRPLEALSIVYPRFPSVDERRYIELVAGSLGMPLHTYEQEKKLTDDLVHWARLVDTPYRAASLAQYAEHYAQARSHGLQTILNGQHAEFVMAMEWFRLEHYLTRGRFRAAHRELSARRAKGHSWIRLARFTAGSLAPDVVMDARRALSRRRRMPFPAWIDPKRANVSTSAMPWERWRSLQLAAIVGPGISLEAAEVCEAVSGVRTRKPWTDVDVFELFLSLPAEQKYPELRSKGLARRLLRGRVPAEILDREDKTVYDEAALARIDHGALRALIQAPGHRIRGVDYRLLGERLSAGNLDMVEFGWARNLANVHAFLSLW